ncbi:MAG: signal peptidase II [Trueperaceae bacterium]|nr:signal peptidase II [Trueperaceae bacterium]
MFLLIAAAVVVADQVSKIWAASTLPLGGPEVAIGLGFNLTYVRNTGAAFGILPNSTLILGILSAVVSLFLIVYLWRSGAQMSRVQYAALTLILGGAVGNMIDRFRLGYVIDFIHFRLPNFNYPVFNLADSAVVIGAGLLIIASFGSDEQEHDEDAGEPFVSDARNKESAESTD